MSRYTRTGAAYTPDRKGTICTALFILVICGVFFIALGGAALIFPPIEDTNSSQLYRLYAYIEPKSGNFSTDFFMEVTLFNETTIVDKFSIAGYENTTDARGNGNLLWSLNLIEGLVVEMEPTRPSDFIFHWFDTIHSDDSIELSPSERNMYEWTFDYSLYWIKIQLGPRFNQTTTSG